MLRLLNFRIFQIDNDMIKQYAHGIISFMLLFSALEVTAQIDSIMFTSGDFIVGEVKTMQKGILQVETDYSDSDFKIEWSKVSGIRTQSQFMITLSNGEQHYGRLQSASDSTINILEGIMDTVHVSNMEIVYLNAYNDKFSDRLSASISLGFDMTKAQNLRTLTTRSSLGYVADKWTLGATYNTLISTQDKVEDIKRTDGDLTFRYVLPYRLYAITTLAGLANTEQKLDLRINAQLGLGIFLVQTNRLYWGGKVGFNRNIENYSNETEDRSSWEGYLGTEVNLFDTGDIDVYFLFMAYPSITEPGRFRSDSKIDFKYELPLDFFIKVGLSLNYDNRPANDASETDYVFQAGFGWEW